MGFSERLAFEVAPDARAAAEARHRTVRAARSRIAGDRRMALELLVSEVVTNAVVHGSARDPLRVCVTLDDDAIRVEVANSGAGFVPAPRALEPDEVGGWGLYLVERLARAWGVTSGERTKVWFELACGEGDRGRGPAARA